MWRRQRPDDPTPSPREALEERLSAYLDGEVTDAEAAEVEALLSSETPEGQDARAYLDDLALLTSALSSIAEVRAPRSFAIPATASGSPSNVPAAFQGFGRSMALVRRMEWAFRASAAAAALFFVVAVVNPTAETPVANLAAGSAEDSMTTMQALPEQDGQETLRASGEDGQVPSIAPAPQPGGGSAPGEGTNAGTDAPSGGGAGSSDGSTDAEDVGVQGLATADGDASDDGSSRVDESQPGNAAFTGPESGTARDSSSSDGVGGVAPALGVLAVLLTALSVLMARTRAATNTDRP